MKKRATFLKQIIFLALLMFCFQNTKAQKIVNKPIKKELPEKMLMHKNIFILGKWKIKKTEGEVYEKIRDSLYKVEGGFSGWTKNHFVFTPEKMTVYSNYTNKPLRRSPYEITNNGNSILVKKSTGEYTVQISVDQKKMTITYTPEAFLRNLANEGEQNYDFFKNRFYIPHNVVFYLERQTN